LAGVNKNFPLRICLPTAPSLINNAAQAENASMAVAVKTVAQRAEAEEASHKFLAAQV
jgi:hypothetical protein